MKTKWWAVVMVLFATLLTSTAQLFYKLATKNPLTPNPVDLLRNYPLVLGLFLYFIAAGMLVIALKGGELSVLYPLIALSYVWVSILSVLFLSESMSLLKWGGVAIIMIGMFFIGKGSDYGS